MKILVINAGSSSLKYQLFDMEQNSVVAKGIVEKVGVKGSSIKNHKDAFQLALKNMLDAGCLKLEAGIFTIDCVGHRVVHGGEYFKEPVVITDDVIEKITECSDLAPLHNPANLQAIFACKGLLKNIPQVAVFDTAFYQGMTPEHYLYALPIKYYEQYKIRRYGFHGTSHQFVYDKLIQNSEFKMQKNKVITCHVGNGVSVTAIKDGRVVETSMGMTPLEGLMMGTRSGNIDPAIIPYLMAHEDMTLEQINNLLNKQSGLLGVSGVSSDMRDILAGIKKGNNKCSLAFDMYINALVKYIGAYASILGGVDVIVLTAGVMEHRAILRSMLLEKLSWMGVTLDVQANADDISGEKIISTLDSKVTVIVIPTDEELMIAKQTFKLVNSESFDFAKDK